MFNNVIFVKIKKKMASKKVKKEIRDWAIFASILLILYLTGLHTNVAAFAQRMVLATGIANPKTEIKEEDFLISIAPLNVLKKIERLNHSQPQQQKMTI